MYLDGEDRGLRGGSRGGTKDGPSSEKSYLRVIEL
jgi:hypothetical protein